ncbi:hypothetical protein Q3G72_005294 [Acer saccharum]|nr:hypothetical protein Q3G72_005294 [Acer saccharum]
MAAASQPDLRNNEEPKGKPPDTTISSKRARSDDIGESDKLRTTAAESFKSKLLKLRFMFFWCCTTSLTFHILAKRCTPIPQALQAQKDHQRDLEIAELRRTVELLQRQLEQQQNNHQQRRNLHEARGEDEDQNPFSVDDDSSDEDHFNPMPLRQTNRRDGDVKVDVPEFNGKMQGV